MDQMAVDAATAAHNKARQLEERIAALEKKVEFLLKYNHDKAMGVK